MMYGIHCHNDSIINQVFIVLFFTNRIHVHVLTIVPSSEKERNEGTRNESIETE